MPANEQTWRSQKTSHIVFGVSTFIMLIATIWMMGKDHVREWKGYQLQYRNVAEWTDRARLEQAQVVSRARLAELRADLRVAESEPLSEDALEDFKTRLRREEYRLENPEEEADNVSRETLQTTYPDVGQSLDGPVTALSEAAARAAELRNVREEKRAAMNEAVKARREADPPSETLVAAATAATVAFHDADAALAAAEQEAIDARSDVLAELDDFVREAKRREDAVLTAKKFKAAEHTAAVSLLGIAIEHEASEAEVALKQRKINALKSEMDDLDAQVAAANEYRAGLEAVIRGEIQARPLAAEKLVNETEAELDLLREKIKSAAARVGDRIVRSPVLDAFNNTDLRIDQIWLPDMKIDYNFSDVARFDRCITCHRAIDKTQPGSATKPLFPNVPAEQRRRGMPIQLQTPEDPPPPLDSPDADGSADPDQEVSAAVDENPLNAQLEAVYGFRLARFGQLADQDITVIFVIPDSPAARSGLRMGDILDRFGNAKVRTAGDAYHYLLGEQVRWGEPIELTVRRGLPQPFTSHPRLDLFVGSMSPHKMGEIGCTICHDGQGSATDFKFASHTPNTAKQAEAWYSEHGWFDNHHWIFPMSPRRFIESNCLKCHHEVAELEPSDRFPEPPAPKLVEGWKLIKSYGCYGCHEINGYAGADQRIGPDLRNEPTFFAVAQQLHDQPDLTEEQRGWAAELVHHPENAAVRRLLVESIQRDKELAAAHDASAGGDSDLPEPRLSAATHEMADLLKDVDAPGKLRKTGPSLRYLKHKVDFDWLYSWIRRPADFRPSTKMPQFFGHFDHLDAEKQQFTVTNPDGTTREVTDREYTQRYEQIEIRAMSEFLLAASSEFEPLPRAEAATEEPSVERGKREFQLRCVACHSHRDFPEIHADQGPDLSTVAAKFDSPKGREWLYSWLKDPPRYHARTVMPVLYLDPIEEKDATGTPTGKIFDPAADLVAFLMSVGVDWKPSDIPSRDLTPEDVAALDDLAMEWMQATFSRRKAAKYLKEGIPAEVASGLKGVESVLSVDDAMRERADFEEQLLTRKLHYVGRRSINKYGCFGCHDIPGYEGAKPIGTALAEWGRKEPAKLAFEQIQAYLTSHGLDGKADSGDEPHHHGGGHGLDPLKHDADTGFFLLALNSHQRQGFLWQKLRAPRSYDFAKTKNKGYNERLRMPQFPFDAEQREKVMTFVLGLTSEPPAEKYIYQPDARQEALVQGRIVLDKYNCAGCHVIEMDRWKFAYEPEYFDSPPETEDYPFLAPTLTAAQIKESLEVDEQGMRSAYIHGRPLRSQTDQGVQRVDEDGVELEPDDDETEPYYWFVLWRQAVLNGEAHLPGQQLLLPAGDDGFGPRHGTAYPGWGGDLANYLFPLVIEWEKEINPQFQGNEAWGQLPPPLVGEGTKVQPDWLHDFLLDPYAIRPAARLRMPKFNMSSDEASTIVNFFAAADNAVYPYEYNPRRRGEYLAELEKEQPEYLHDAMNIVVNQNYCVKCHGVGDFMPKGNASALAPDLADAYRRLRPDYVHRWVANPKRILPYTGMPVNIPYPKGISQDIFPGSAEQQLNGLVDLLMNYDEYSKRETEIAPLVEAAKPPPGEEPAGEAAAAGL